MSSLVPRSPHPADFPAPPSPRDSARWAEADRAERPVRLARLRSRLALDGLDAYFALRSEHMRYLTGFVLHDGEDLLAGNSGRFLVTADEVLVLADSRYRLQAVEQAPKRESDPPPTSSGLYGDRSFPMSAPDVWEWKRPPSATSSGKCSGTPRRR